MRRIAVSGRKPEKGIRKLTLQDVADKLGVSKATVSLAINGSPLVAQRTREKILKIVEEFGYVYNRKAASMSTGKTRTVGLAVHDITNPYFSEVCAAIESVLSQHGMMSFLCNTNESIERQERFIDTLAEHQADGIILCPAAGTNVKSLQPHINRRLPAVLLARDVKGTEFDYVGNDDFLALKMVTEHLIRLGHDRIAMIGGGQLTSTSKLRRAGYFAAMEENRVPVDPDLVIDCAINPRGGEGAVKKVLEHKRPATAISCFSDLVAIGVISGLYRMGARPGRDIAIVGCDDVEEAGRAYVELTTARIQKWAIGQSAADVLIRRIADPDLPIQRIIIKPDLIIRKSCGSAID
jgi:LacI family transcriptional regulator